MRVTRSAVAGLLAAGTLAVVGAGPAYAADNVCSSVDPSTPRADTGRASVPYQLLGIEGARAAAPSSGRPVGVAVLSSGVAETQGGIRVSRHVDLSSGGELGDPQGTLVAGLVAGRPRADGQPVGVDPRAEVVDVRVFVDQQSNVPREQPSTPALAAGLRWVAQHADGLGLEVAVVPFVVRASSELLAAVRAVQARDVVVVAASGDRPADGSDFAGDFPSPRALDEDAGPLFFPAGYPHVVAVSTTATGGPDDVLDLVVKNSRTTVAAPSYDAVSYGLNGKTCVVRPASTTAAAAEVAGVLALLRQRYPDETSAQVAARLVGTADGTPDDPTPLTGAGVVQPYEALTRPLAPAADGTLERTTVHATATTRAAAPKPDTDLLATMRERALWWGLIGGGLLVIALLLRPVLARRRA